MAPHILANLGGVGLELDELAILDRIDFPDQLEAELFYLSVVGVRRVLFIIEVANAFEVAASI